MAPCGLLFLSPLSSSPPCAENRREAIGHIAQPFLCGALEGMVTYSAKRKRFVSRARRQARRYHLPFGSPCTHVTPKTQTESTTETRVPLLGRTHAMERAILSPRASAMPCCLERMRQKPTRRPVDGSCSTLTCSKTSSPASDGVKCPRRIVG